MKVLYNALKDFVALPDDAKPLLARMPLHGLPIESVEDSAAGPVIDLEIFNNRGDLLGHYGVARELATLIRGTLKSVRPQLKESSTPASSATRVEIECPELCGRYTARVIRGVKVQPSPDWLRQRLESLGQASINNVVDATNYIMLDLGHPMHAFDMDKLAEGRIVVRRARAGEKMRTLDGIERKLSPDMCMIADAQKAVAIGGVMGGAESEISFASKNILLESAWFDPISIRKGAKAVGLRTEASIRFERGADIENAELASRRCAALIQELAGGEILSGVVDAYPKPWSAQKIELTRKELLRILGADVPDNEIEAILGSLGFAPRRTDANRGSKESLMAVWECARTSWRLDVTREIDLIEEIARHYGFDKFPPKVTGACTPSARLPHAAADDRIRARLRALGYNEISTIPIVDPADDAIFRAENVTPAGIGNPLAEDSSIMRTNGLASMARTLEWNINRGQHNVKLYEIGRRYELKNGPPAVAGQPVETRILTLGVTGQAREKSIHESARPLTFAELKGDLDSLSAIVGGFSWSTGGPSWLHPVRSANVVLPSGSSIGYAGQLHRRAAEHFKLRQDAFVAEFALDPLYAASDAAYKSRKYSRIPKFPAVERDFSLILADSVAFESVAATIRALGIAELSSVEAVDLFRGGQIPKGKYSLLVRVTLQSNEATFTDAQLTDFSSRIVTVLEKNLSATLRTS
ncbi:MAG: phenylalanine--tRNA ligase subunit beta [Acidobacteria bacterium]|nr:phenylalanine--tRNA ligase subunit beta [Acidobacteriota bacterium]